MKTYNGEVIDFEPKLNFNHRVTFTSGFNIPSFVIFSCSRPSCKIQFNQLLWNDIELKMFDPIELSTSKSIMNYLTQETKDDIKFKLELLDSVGDAIETWEIKATLSEVDFDVCDWYKKPEDAIKINMKLKPLTVDLK